MVREESKYWTHVAAQRVLGWNQVKSAIAPPLLSLCFVIPPLDGAYRCDLFVLRSGISRSRSPLPFRKRHFVRCLSLLCPRIWNFRLDSVAYLIEVVTTLRRVSNTPTRFAPGMLAGLSPESRTFRRALISPERPDQPRWKKLSLGNSREDAICVVIFVIFFCWVLPYTESDEKSSITGRIRIC